MNGLRARLPQPGSLSLRQQLGFATGVLCLFLVAVVASGASLVGREQARRSVSNEMAELARTVADRFDRGLNARLGDTRLVSELDPLRNAWTGDAEAVRTALEQLQQKVTYSAWIGFAGRDGIVRAATQGMLEGEDVGSMAWFRHGQTGIVAQGVHDAGPLADIVGESPSGRVYGVIDLAAPVLDINESFAGVLGLQISMRWAEDLLSSALGPLNRGTQTELWLLSRRGQVLVGPNVGDFPFPPLRRVAMAREGSGSFTDDLSAEPSLTGFALTKGAEGHPGLGWIVVARRPTAIAYAQANRLVSVVLGLGLVVGAIGIGIAILISNRVAGPIHRLTEEADKIGRDPENMMLPLVRGSMEVAHLSSALRSLLRRIDVTEQEKAAVERRSVEEAQRLHQDIDALKELADTDPLTRLPNRRGMMRHCERMLSLWEREGKGFAVLVIDIDHFKHVNDTYGHAVGDDVIRTVAERVAAAIRPSDCVARFGGEEFVAVLGDVHLLRAGDVAERVRGAVEAASILHGDKTIEVTISAGVAVASPSDRDIQDVIERADLALYDAKTRGRNRVALRVAEPVTAEQAA